MSILMIPPLDNEAWPTLGPQVCQFIEENLVFGPGDLRGEPARLDAEKRALIYRMYEVYPQGHPQAGRRRFKRVGISLRKGSAKSELGAWIVAVELHPEGPVRTIGWDKYGQPIGGPVSDPYIPMLAYTEEQSDELAYGALRDMLELSPVGKDFDIGMARIMRASGEGKAVALATAPEARDGARTTFQFFDETWHWTLPRLRRAHQTMLANIPKRFIADAWTLETTTAYSPGEGSVAEDTMEYARQVSEGTIKDPRLFFYHRQAGDWRPGAVPMDLSTPEALRAAIIEASGPVAEWSDIEGILMQWSDPTTDKSYLEQVWLNRIVRAADRAFDSERWRELARPDYVVPDGALITLGFDGARFHDATGLVGTEVSTGYQWVIGCWEHPYGIENWEVPEHEVETAIADAMQRWDVWRMYADPPYWETHIAKWAGEFGEKKVLLWRTNRIVPAAYAVRGFATAIQAGDISHDGHPQLIAHVGNACRRKLTLRDTEGVAMYLIQKERSDSPHKIDLAMAAILSWEARRDALTANAEGAGVAYADGRELIVL